jgi:hypothetical protein
MTKFIFESYIPKDDIKIRPEALIKQIYNLFEKEIEDFKDEKSEIILKYINYLYKKIKKRLSNYHFWENVCSYNFCFYQYRNVKDDKDIGKICGRKIDKKNSYSINSNKYLCSEHDRNHRKYHSKSIKLKQNETYCNHINKNGSNCKYSSKINGLCVKHYKYTYNISTEEIYRKIEKNIEFNKIYTNIENEIKTLNNIDIFFIDKKITDNSEIIKKVKENTPSIELSELVGGKLHNSNTSINNIILKNDKNNKEIINKLNVISEKIKYDKITKNNIKINHILNNSFNILHHTPQPLTITINNNTLFISHSGYVIFKTFLNINKIHIYLCIFHILNIFVNFGFMKKRNS